MKLRILLVVFCVVGLPLWAHFAGFGSPILMVTGDGDLRSTALLFFGLAFVIGSLFRRPYTLVIPHALAEAMLVYIVLETIRAGIALEGPQGEDSRAEIPVILITALLFWGFLLSPLAELKMKHSEVVTEN